MAKKLTKGLLQGKEFKKTITVSVYDEDFELDVRPLSGPEAEEVESKMKSGTTMKGSSGSKEPNVAIDLQKQNKGIKDANIKACVHGTVDSDFTEQVVREEWPNTLIEQVSKEVKDISGIGNKSDVERFRNEGKDNEQ